MKKFSGSKKVKHFKYRQPASYPNKRFWSAEKIMSLAALVVSAGTLFTITYQNILIREQQYASVRPHLMLKVSTSNSQDFRIELTNNGVGPAYIKGFRCHYNDQGYEGWYAFLFGVLFKNEVYPNQTDLLGSKYVMPANEVVELLGCYSDSTCFQHLQDIWFNGILEIDYESIYGEEFIYSSQFVTETSNRIDSLLKVYE